VSGDPVNTDPRVDALRQQLKSLGYLDAGVDRFLLASARGTRGPVALAARSSLRVGLLGGVLLGPAAALGLGARLPGLVSGLRDAVVLALYLGVLFFLAVAAIAFLVSLGATALVRIRDDRFAARARVVSRNAGGIIAAACLVYLTFWWRNANAGFGWSAPVWTAFALAVAVGISLLLGHAVRITTLAVLGAGGDPAALPPIAFTSWRTVIGGGVLAFAGAAALLVLAAPAADTRASPDRPPLAVVSPGRTVRVFAIDGVDLTLMGAVMMASGPVTPRLPGVLTSLAAEDTSDPARIWTTIATGQPPDVHGVHGIETRRVAGIKGIVAPGGGALARAIGVATDAVRLTTPSIASRNERRSKTIWEVADDAGLRTAVVNWWATWPAPTGPGIVVTDRALLRLERGGPLDAEISPASLYPALQRAWPSIRKRAQEAAALAFAGIADSGAAAIMRRSAELDLTVLGIAAALPGPRRDLDVVYLPGLDIAQHALLASPEGSGAQIPSAVAARVDALRRYYVFLLDTLAKASAAEPREIVMVVRQPGRVDGAQPGMLQVIQGDYATNAGQGKIERVIDIAPTILHVLGVPLSRELPGRVMGTLLTPEFTERYPERYVPAYGPPLASPPSRSGKPLDQEMIDRLRSLGYVK
jgi:Type I phosphodiesterase / nucleotide pyrophosphatase